MGLTFFKQETHTYVLLFSRSEKLPVYNAAHLMEGEGKLGRNYFNNVFMLAPLVDHLQPKNSEQVVVNVSNTPEMYSLCLDLFVGKSMLKCSNTALLTIYRGAYFGYQLWCRFLCYSSNTEGILLGRIV